MKNLLHCCWTLVGRLPDELSSPPTQQPNRFVLVAYGESELEVLATGITPEQRGGMIRTNLVDIPANGVARGPKVSIPLRADTVSAGREERCFKSIHAEAIVYPVSYVGSFESSDVQLNRIWETAAYTAHLCMQDDIWDAPKRDRGRWAGDRRRQRSADDRARPSAIATLIERHAGSPARG